MLPNCDARDRAVRLVIATLLIVVTRAFWSASPDLPAFLAMLVAMTGVVGWCPVYDLFGVATTTAAGKPRVDLVSQVALLAQSRLDWSSKRSVRIARVSETPADRTAHDRATPTRVAREAA